MRFAEAVLHAEIQINCGGMRLEAQVAAGNHTYQFHEVVVDFSSSALHDEYIFSAHRLSDFDARLTHGEFGQLEREESAGRSHWGCEQGLTRRFAGGMPR